MKTQKTLILSIDSMKKLWILAVILGLGLSSISEAGLFGSAPKKPDVSDLETQLNTGLQEISQEATQKMFRSPEGLRLTSGYAMRERLEELDRRIENPNEQPSFENGAAKPLAIGLVFNLLPEEFQQSSFFKLVIQRLNNHLQKAIANTPLLDLVVLDETQQEIIAKSLQRQTSLLIDPSEAARLGRLVGEEMILFVELKPSMQNLFMTFHLLSIELGLNDFVFDTDLKQFFKEYETLKEIYDTRDFIAPDPNIPQNLIPETVTQPEIPEIVTLPETKIEFYELLRKNFDVRIVFSPKLTGLMGLSPSDSEGGFLLDFSKQSINLNCDAPNRSVLESSMPISSTRFLIEYYSFSNQDTKIHTDCKETEDYFKNQFTSGILLEFAKAYARLSESQKEVIQKIYPIISVIFVSWTENDWRDSSLGPNISYLRLNRTTHRIDLFNHWLLNIYPSSEEIYDILNQQQETETLYERASYQQRKKLLITPTYYAPNTSEYLRNVALREHNAFNFSQFEIGGAKIQTENNTQNSGHVGLKLFSYDDGHWPVDGARLNWFGDENNTYLQNAQVLNSRRSHRIEAPDQLFWGYSFRLFDYEEDNIRDYHLKDWLRVGSSITYYPAPFQNFRFQLDAHGTGLKDVDFNLSDSYLHSRDINTYGADATFCIANPDQTLFCNFGVGIEKFDLRKTQDLERLKYYAQIKYQLASGAGESAWINLEYGQDEWQQAQNQFLLPQKNWSLNLEFQW